MANNTSRAQITKSSERPIGFLLSQVGAAASAKFAEKLKPLKLSPSHAGILRLLSRADHINQRELAEKLSMHPSRLVMIIDELEEKKLVKRTAVAGDRRTHALHLTQKARKLLPKLGEIARQHSEELCAGLTRDERATLRTLLTKIADAQGLVQGVHPGYKLSAR